MALVGGKNASLGEMIGTLKEKGIRFPDGFATTAEVYRNFLKSTEIKGPIEETLEAYHSGEKSLEETGRSIRGRFLNASFPDGMEEAVKKAYRRLSKRYDTDEVDVAVRSSATAEDLPTPVLPASRKHF